MTRTHPDFPIASKERTDASSHIARLQRTATIPLPRGTTGDRTMTPVLESLTDASAASKIVEGLATVRQTALKHLDTRRVEMILGPLCNVASALERKLHAGEYALTEASLLSYSIIEGLAYLKDCATDDGPASGIFWPDYTCEYVAAVTNLLRADLFAAGHVEVAA